MDQELQREYFARAAQLLGGNEATARILDISSRSLRSFISGERRLHSGILKDIAAALIAHADACRTLERRISPAFSGNLNEDNGPPLHDGRQDGSKRIPKTQVDAMARKLGLKPRATQED